ncbi:MAG: 5-(carboxyamino)imidazole ribonucleotide mutase [Spirochaetes bacterium]|nr:5-(carboxyamino)imidazole ribonucleotide mutase [Spirochaetota bacterium]
MISVAVVLGSDSDKAVYERVKNVLSALGVEFERRIISAHRTPDMLKEYVVGAESRGVKLFIAAAGMSAALPGVIASHTSLPVIGVPAVSASPVLGFDSILSILQMPPGVPVACVGVNGGENAALLAVSILALGDASLKKRLRAYREEMRRKVEDKDRRFQEE